MKKHRTEPITGNLALDQDGNPRPRNICDGETLREGQFACFRYIDAGQYDPEGLQWFSGMVLEQHRGPEGEETPIGWLSYLVLCEDGIERVFQDHEEYFPNGGIDPDTGEWAAGEKGWVSH